MFELIRRMVAALVNRFRPFNPPEDPYAAVREPRRGNPSGRSAAVAVAEPERPIRVRAIGASGTRRDTPIFPSSMVTDEHMSRRG
jgi:hypothetical protein